MGEISAPNGNHAVVSMEEWMDGNSKDDVVVHMEDGSSRLGDSNSSNRGLGCTISLPFLQKLIAEVIGTYFLIFAGCASMVVNLISKGSVSFPGVCIVWGLVVMVMVYSVGHISGAHFNPAVTIAFANCGRFPGKQHRSRSLSSPPPEPTP